MKRGRPVKVKEPNISAALQDCINCTGVSPEAYEDLLVFMTVLEAQQLVASKETHYVKLHAWSNAVNGFAHKTLMKHKFVNAGAIMGIEQPADANFWWHVYCLIANVCYSPNLHSKVADYHSSAYERNEALIEDLRILIERVIK